MGTKRKIIQQRFSKFGRGSNAVASCDAISAPRGDMGCYQPEGSRTWRLGTCQNPGDNVLHKSGGKVSYSKS